MIQLFTGGAVLSDGAGGRASSSGGTAGSPPGGWYSYRRQHLRRPHMPDSLDGLRLRCCAFAILIEIGANSFRKVEQQSALPHGP